MTKFITIYDRWYKIKDLDYVERYYFRGRRKILLETLHREEPPFVVLNWDKFPND